LNFPRAGIFLTPSPNEKFRNSFRVCSPNLSRKWATKMVMCNKIKLIEINLKRFSFRVKGRKLLISLYSIFCHKKYKFNHKYCYWSTHTIILPCTYHKLAQNMALKNIDQTKRFTFYKASWLEWFKLMPCITSFSTNNIRKMGLFNKTNTTKP